MPLYALIIVFLLMFSPGAFAAEFSSNSHPANSFSTVQVDGKDFVKVAASGEVYVDKDRDGKFERHEQIKNQGITSPTGTVSVPYRYILSLHRDEWTHQEIAAKIAKIFNEAEPK